MDKKHVLVISQYFYPENFRINDICKEWIKRGYKVTVITGIPNYPKGKFYKGYNWFKKRKETWNEIEIVRLPIISRGHSKIRLIMNYLSFIVSGFFWKVFTKIKADYIFTFEVSPMTQALLGVWYSQKRKVPHYLYVQDLWPENLEAVAGIHNKTIVHLVEKMVAYIYQNTNIILATSPSFVQMIQSRLIEDKGKVKYWPQYAEDIYCPMPKRACKEIPEDDCFKIIFTGNIGEAQGLELLPKTAKVLKDKGQKVKFIIVGDGRQRQKLEKTVQENKVENMFLMLGQKPAEQIPYLLAACDVAFISFMDNPLFAATIPAKLQSYMACGMPIIASATGETKRIIEDAQCGICCPLGDVMGLIDGIEKLMSMDDLQIFGGRAKFYNDKYFSKKELMNKIEHLLGSHSFEAKE